MGETGQKVRAEMDLLVKVKNAIAFLANERDSSWIAYLFRETTCVEMFITLLRPANVIRLEFHARYRRWN